MHGCSLIVVTRFRDTVSFVSHRILDEKSRILNRLRKINKGDIHLQGKIA